jgi:hypothetical protein
VLHILLAIVVASATVGCGFLDSYCPTGLGQGALANDGHGNAILVTADQRQPVQWPDGYSMDPGPPLRLLDEHGDLVASEGEWVYVGGGMDATDEIIVACGDVSTDPP